MVDCERILVEYLERLWGCTWQEKIARDFEEQGKALKAFIGS